MARMNWREANRARWVGIRLAHEGEQLLRTATANNATVVLYTVPAEKTLYLCAATMGFESHDNEWNRIWIADETDTPVFYLFETWSQNTTTIPHAGQSYWPPIELPALYTVKIFSATADRVVRGSIFGWVQ